MAKSPSATKPRFPWAHTMASPTIIFSLISVFQRSDGAFCDLMFARCGTMFLEHTTKKTQLTLIFHHIINCNRQRRLFQKPVPAVHQKASHLQRVRGNPDLHWEISCTIHQLPTKPQNNALFERGKSTKCYWAVHYNTHNGNTGDLPGAGGKQGQQSKHVA